VDVRMPDGTVIKNVPKGTTKAELSRKLGLFQDEGMSLRALPPLSFEEETAQREAQTAQMQEQLPEQIPGFQLPHPEGMTKEGLQTARENLPLAASAPAAMMGGGAVVLPALRALMAAGGTKTAQEIAGGEGISEAVKSGAVEGAEIGAGTLAGGLAFKHLLAPAGRAIFGTKPGIKALEAIEFAKNKLITAGKTPRLATLDRAFLKEEGGAFLPIDAINDASLLQTTRFLLAGGRSSNVRAATAAKFINKEINKLVGRPTPDASEVALLGKSAFELHGIPIKAAGAADDFINEAVTSVNAKALHALKASNPEVHQVLLAKRLANVFEKFKKPKLLEGKPIYDGAALNKWVIGNKKMLRDVYGEATAGNMASFTNYVRFLDDITESASKGLGLSPPTLQGVTRLAVEGGAMKWMPGLGDPGVAATIEAGSWSLGNTLMNPTSKTFRFFQALPSAAHAVKAGVQLAGAKAALSDKPKKVQFPKGVSMSGIIGTPTGTLKRPKGLKPGSLFKIKDSGII